MKGRVIFYANLFATVLERILALGILLGISAFSYKSVTALMGMDWQRTETFYELIYRILLLVIGVELIRNRLTHDLMAILELLAFVVARKMLKPELPTLIFFWESQLLSGCLQHADSCFRRLRANPRDGEHLTSHYSTRSRIAKIRPWRLKNGKQAASRLLP
jgi:hypothetical protein